jgi:hypothetical protein
MKTTGIFCLFILIFGYNAGFAFAESDARHFPVSEVAIQPITMEKIPEQIAMLQQNIASMSSLLMQMSSVLREQNLTGEQQRKCGDYLGEIATSLMSCAGDMSSTSVAEQKMEIEQLEREWNYWESEDFESH